jgi:hypothetical protein
VLHPEGSREAETFVYQRGERILNGQVSQVVKGLRQIATKRRLTGTKAKTLRDVAGYYHHNRERMRYDVYLKTGGRSPQARLGRIGAAYTDLGAATDARYSATDRKFASDRVREIIKTLGEHGTDESMAKTLIAQAGATGALAQWSDLVRAQAGKFFALSWAPYFRAGYGDLIPEEWQFFQSWQGKLEYLLIEGANAKGLSKQAVRRREHRAAVPWCPSGPNRHEGQPCSGARRQEAEDLLFGEAGQGQHLLPWVERPGGGDGRHSPVPGRSVRREVRADVGAADVELPKYLRHPIFSTAHRWSRVG